jgi:cell division protein FtsL
MRILGIFLFLAVISAAAFVYDIKYRTTRLARESAALENSIHNEENSISALRAEWSALNQPSRLQALAKRHLPEFQNLAVSQMAFAYELPDRAADLGKFISNLDEQKGLETPIDKKVLKVKAASAPASSAPMKLIPIPLR